MPLSGVYTPRRDARGLFVPRRRSRFISNEWGNTSTDREWGHFCYATQDGLYWSASDKIFKVGQYGGVLTSYETPYGLSIDAPSGWQMNGASIATPGGRNIFFQTNVSLFYLYDAAKISSGYPPVFGSSLNAAPNPWYNSASWINSSGEQSILISGGGTTASITGVQNGLHCLVFMTKGNNTGAPVPDSTRVFLDGELVASVERTDLNVANYNENTLPYYFHASISKSAQDIGGIIFNANLWNYYATDDEARRISLDPLRHFFVDAPDTRHRLSRNFISVPASLTTKRPVTDVAKTGWSANPSGELYKAIGEESFNDSTYIISPDISSGLPYVTGITRTPAGSYLLKLRARRQSDAGQIRVVMQNNTGASVGASTWTSLTNSFAEYSFPITTTGEATQIKVEVQ